MQYGEIIDDYYDMILGFWENGFTLRKRDVSLHTMTDEGTKVQDTLLTIAETAKKLGVNLYDYLFDRVSKTYAMPSLADVIRERSGQVDARV
jgi:hypothetical protein